MNCESIQATALKGKTFAHALGAITIFTGTNDAGKTARADAIRLSLLGHLPEHGKTAAATMALASANTMTVTAQFTGQPTVARTWKRTGKKHSATASGAESLPETPLVMLDAREYLGKSDAGRVQMLFDCLQLKGEEWTIDATRARLKEKATVADFDTLTAAVDGETIQQWLDRMADVLKDAASEANAEAARFEKTAQGITQLSLEEEPVDAGRVSADIATARKQLGELQAEQGRLGEVVKQQATGAEARAGLAQAIATMVAQLGDRPLPDRDAAAIEAELGAVQQRRGDLAGQHQRAVTAAEAGQSRAAEAGQIEKKIAAAAAAEAELGSLRAALETMQAEFEAFTDETETASVQARIAELGATKKGLAEAAEKLAKQQDAAREEYNAQVGKPCCPTCGLKGGDFAEAIERKLESTLAALTEEAAAVQQRFELVTGNIAESNATLNARQAAGRRREALERNVKDATTKVEAADKLAESLPGLRAQLAQLGDTSGKLPEAPAELKTMDQQIAGLRDELFRLRTAAELTAKRAELANFGSVGDDDAEEQQARVEMEIEATTERLEELAALEQKAANQLADQKRLAEAQESRTKAVAKGETLAALRKVLAAEREALIKASFGPLLETANTFTADILPTPLEYREGELGRFQGANWIPVRAFGGCYTAVTYAGIQAALGVQAPAKIVMVDELGTMTAENKSRFLRNVRRAINEGKIEQFVGMDIVADDYSPEVVEGYGLTVVNIA